MGLSVEFCLMRKVQLGLDQAASPSPFQGFLPKGRSSCWAPWEPQVQETSSCRSENCPDTPREEGKEEKGGVRRGRLGSPKPTRLLLAGQDRLPWPSWGSREAASLQEPGQR